MSSFPTEAAGWRRLPAQWLPSGMFGRLVLLLGATLAATLLIAGWTLRTVSIEPGGEQMADLLAGQLVAAQALARYGAPADPQPADPQMTATEADPLLDIEYAAAAPVGAHRPWLPFLRRLSARLQQRLGAGTQVLIDEGPPSRLWVQPAQAPARWIGVAVPHFASQAALLSLTTALSGLALVLLAASWFARSLSRPLVRLARAAPQLAQGELADPRLGSDGPREVRQLAAALIGAAVDVRAAARDRDLMLAGLSHDLRTPLARLRLALELLQGEQGLRDEMVQDLEELDGIVGQFIDYARDGREEGRQRIDLAALLQTLAAQEWAGCDWRYHGPAQQSVSVRPLALQRALANLLRNARRHGAAPFELRLLDDSVQLRVTVCDRGSGVPAAQLGALGQPFFRADGASEVGSGLGLAVAARVAAQHGGALHCRNRDDGGFEAELRLGACLLVISLLLALGCARSPVREEAEVAPSAYRYVPADLDSRSLERVARPPPAPTRTRSVPNCAT